MPGKMVIKGVPPYDGEWAADLGSFKSHELHTIKVFTEQGGGKPVRGAELQEALNAGDQAAFLGVVKVVLQRHNVEVVDLILWNSDSEAIEYTQEEVPEDEALKNSEAPSENGNSPGEQSAPADETGTSGTAAKASAE